MGISSLIAVLVIMIAALIIMAVAKKLIKAAFFIVLFLIAIITISSFLGLNLESRLKEGTAKITGYIVGVGKEKTVDLAEKGINQTREYIAREIST